MTTTPATPERLFRFYAVGFLGVLVQLTVLQALAGQVRTNYLLATAVAVEIAIIHNFLWHDRWTWRSRTSGTDSLALRLTRFFKFNLSTGAVSLAVNLGVTSLLVEAARVPYMFANTIAIATGSVATFFLSDLVVFPARPSTLSVFHSRGALRSSKTSSRGTDVTFPSR